VLSSDLLCAELQIQADNIVLRFFFDSLAQILALEPDAETLVSLCLRISKASGALRANSTCPVYHAKINGLFSAIPSNGLNVSNA
jgi:hypothetical protein